MLILSRKFDQRILIGDGITITVVAIGRDCVRLGIDAPEDVEIDREEIRIRKDREKRRKGGVGG